MSDKVGFNEAIFDPASNSQISAVEAFDDYFFLSGRKYQVLSSPQGQKPGKALKTKSVDVRSNIPLNILKVLSYFTGIIPLIMLIGKAIARSQYEFRTNDRRVLNTKEETRVVKNISDKPIDIQPIITDTLLLQTKKEEAPLPTNDEVKFVQEEFPSVILVEEEEEGETFIIVETSYDLQSIDVTETKEEILKEEVIANTQVLSEHVVLPEVKKQVGEEVIATTIPETPEPSPILPVVNVKIDIDPDFVPEPPNYTVLPPVLTDEDFVPEPPSYTVLPPVSTDEDFVPEPPSYTVLPPVLTDENLMPEPPNYTVLPPVTKEQAAEAIATSVPPVMTKDDLIKSAVHILKITKEIADTETTHHQSMIQHLEVMSKKEFSTALKKSSSSDIEFLKTFLDEYRGLIEKTESVQQILQVVAATETATAENSQELMKAQVNDLCVFFATKNFNEYMDALIEMSSFSAAFNEIVDLGKGKSLLAKINEKLPFEPCNILVQRIGRYPLLLKEIRKNVEKIGLTEEMKSLTQALNYFNSKAVQFDKICEIDEIKKMIAAYNEAHGTFKFFNSLEKAQTRNAIISYKETKKSELAAINKNDPNQSSIEMELKEQRLELLKIKLT